MAFTPLNALSAFVAVARRLSYAAAAKKLGVTPSALSQSVRQLEMRLGTTLLRRTSRSVSLTEAGQRLLSEAGPAVDLALRSLDAVKASKDDVVGKVRLTVPAIAVQMVLVRLLPKFAELHPEVEVEIFVEEQMTDPVARGLDGGIRLVEAINRDMVHVRLTPAARLVIAGSPAYLRRRGVPQKPEDLLQHACLGLRWSSEGEPWAWELERNKKSWRLAVRGPVTSNDGELICEMAVAGVGLVYGWEFAVAPLVAQGKLQLVLEPYALELPGLFLYFPSRAQMSPALKAFVALARSQLAALTKASRS